MQRAYPGNTDSKSLVRYAVNSRILLIQPTRIREEYPSITLAGNDVGDLNPWTYHLKIPRKQQIYVDRQEEGLKRVRELSPLSHTVYGDISKALRSDWCNKTALVNLDFCGRVTNDNMQAVADAGKTCVDHGVIVLTCLSGREQRTDVSWGYAKTLARSTAGRRMLGVAACMAYHLGPEFIPFIGMRYTRMPPKGFTKWPQSSFITLGFQRIKDAGARRRCAATWSKERFPYDGDIRNASNVHTWMHAAVKDLTQQLVFKWKALAVMNLADTSEIVSPLRQRPHASRRTMILERRETSLSRIQGAVTWLHAASATA